jgi:hypothetical protein
VGLEETDRTQVALVGGKGAHLGELSRVNGIRVPAGRTVDKLGGLHPSRHDPTTFWWLFAVVLNTRSTSVIFG